MVLKGPHFRNRVWNTRQRCSTQCCISKYTPSILFSIVDAELMLLQQWSMNRDIIFSVLRKVQGPCYQFKVQILREINTSSVWYKFDKLTTSLASKLIRRSIDTVDKKEISIQQSKIPNPLTPAHRMRVPCFSIFAAIAYANKNPGKMDL